MNEILTVQEAAHFLNKYPGTIRRWIKSKKFPAKKIAAGKSGVYALLKTDLLEYIIKLEVKKESQPHPVRVPRRDTRQEHLPI